jgi:hypothetical protein
MAGRAQQVAAVEEDARVDVPRQAEEAVAARRRHDVGVEDAGEVVVARDAGVRAPARSSGSSASSAVSSGSQVLPSWQRSGSASPA